jgi:DNA invertase Pin-like site-specific DNA recombinase
MAVYGYVRVSSDRQVVDNQEFEINNFCERNNIKVDSWIRETISGTKGYDKRLLGGLLKRAKKDDLIICSELSRLGRSLFMIMDILNILMEKECRLWTIKDGYRLGDDIQSKVLAFAFGLSAEIERNLISQRTKEALARKKAEGVVLGRPKGALKRIEQLKVYKHRDLITKLRELGTSYSKIAKIIKVNRITLSSFINEFMPEYAGCVTFIKTGACEGNCAEKLRQNLELDMKGKREEANKISDKRFQAYEERRRGRGR